MSRLPNEDLRQDMHRQIEKSIFPNVLTQIKARFRITTVRLALLNSFFFVIGIWITIALVYWQVSIFMEHRVDHIIDLYAKNFENLALHEVIKTVDESVRRDSRKIELYGVFTNQGVRLSGNLNYLPNEITLNGETAEFEYKDSSEFFKNDLQISDELRSFPARAKSFNIDSNTVLVIGRNVSEFEAIRKILLNGLITGSSIILTMGFLIGITLAVPALRRIQYIQLLSKKIMLGDFTLRLPISKRNDEIDILATTINSVMTEIEELISEIRGVTATIAHDLRTPLTRVRLMLSKGILLTENSNFDATQRSLLAHELFIKSIEESDHLLARFTAILRIAEIENHMRKAGFKNTRLEDVLQQIYEMFEPIAEDKGLKLILELEPTAPVYADPNLLLEAVSNLVDNAIKYSPTPDSDKDSPDSKANTDFVKCSLEISTFNHLSVIIRLKTVDSYPVIDIIDSGIGISEDVFNTFNQETLNAAKFKHSLQSGLEASNQNSLTTTQFNYSNRSASTQSINQLELSAGLGKGFGLGLGIARAIFRLHHFEMTALPRSKGAHLSISCKN